MGVSLLAKNNTNNNNDKIKCLRIDNALSSAEMLFHPGDLGRGSIVLFYLCFVLLPLPNAIMYAQTIVWGRYRQRMCNACKILTGSIRFSF